MIIFRRSDFNAHLLSTCYQRNWFQRTSAFYNFQMDCFQQTCSFYLFQVRTNAMHIWFLHFPTFSFCMFQRNWFSTHIFFLHCPKELISTHMFVLNVTKELIATQVFSTFSKGSDFKVHGLSRFFIVQRNWFQRASSILFLRKLIFKPHVFYIFQRNWYQRTSSFYIVRRKWFWKHILFLHVPKELISTYIFFLDSLSSTGTKGVAKGTSSILRVSRKLMFTVFYMFKRIFFSTHIFSLHVPNKLVLKARFL